MKDLRVGIIRVIRYAEIGTAAAPIYQADDMTHLFKLLDSGRIEVAIAVRNAGIIELQKSFKDSGIKIIGKPLHSAPLFHFLHRKNKHLIAKLDRVLQEMRNSGELETLVDKTFQQLQSK